MPRTASAGAGGQLEWPLASLCLSLFLKMQLLACPATPAPTPVALHLSALPYVSALAPGTVSMSCPPTTYSHITGSFFLFSHVLFWVLPEIEHFRSSPEPSSSSSLPTFRLVLHFPTPSLPPPALTLAQPGQWVSCSGCGRGDIQLKPQGLVLLGP